MKRSIYSSILIFFNILCILYLLVKGSHSVALMLKIEEFDIYAFTAETYAPFIKFAIAPTWFLIFEIILVIVSFVRKEKYKWKGFIAIAIKVVLSVSFLAIIFEFIKI